MANHRMFSNRIANSAKFLQMPAEAQVLYFHMILRADDDGIVEAYPLMKLLGSAPDVFKVLLAKGYIQELNEDQVIVIMDWLEHNTIRADRKVNSIYHHLIPKDVKILLPKPRSDVEDNSKRLGGLSTDGLSKDKLSKDKLSKDKLSKDKLDIATASVAEWSLEDSLEKMETVSNSYLDIIASFIREKPVVVENSKQLSAVISRYVRVAQKLSGAYTNKQIFEAADKIKEDNKKRQRNGDEVDYTLETIYKYLTK